MTRGAEEDFMKVVSVASLFFLIWTYSSHWPAPIHAPPSDDDLRSALAGAPKPCETPPPAKKAVLGTAFLGVCTGD